MHVEVDGSRGVASHSSPCELGGCVTPRERTITRFEGCAKVVDDCAACGEDLAVVDVHRDRAFDRGVGGIRIMVDSSIGCTGFVVVGCVCWVKACESHSCFKAGLEYCIGLLEAVELHTKSAVCEEKSRIVKLV